MRKELWKVTKSELQKIEAWLERGECEELLVVAVDDWRSSEIYFVIDDEKEKKAHLFLSLQNVIDYKYDDTDSPAMLAKFQNGDKFCWIGFMVSTIINRYAGVVYDPWKYHLFELFTVIKDCTQDSQANFISDFSYLKYKKVVDINGNKYMFDNGGYGSHKEFEKIWPMYGRYFKAQNDGMQRIESGFYPYDFGSYASIIPLESQCPYIHGYLGKNETGSICAMKVLCDSEELKSVLEEWPMLSKSGFEYDVKFNKLVENIEFVKRSFEMYNSKSTYVAVDIWRIIYENGSRAVVLHTVGDRDYAAKDGNLFSNFILQEDYIKSIF